tara:strand:- start:276 stop:812 length:537 start_codon:yes stop_codon:yes gene_type:complete
MEEVKKAMNLFAKSVVMQSKRNLTREGKRASSSLHKSIKYDLDVYKNSFSLSFLMEDYGQFVDQGVKGANPSMVKNGKQKAPNAPFKFKRKKPPLSAMMEFAKRKSIRFRGKSGRFKDGDRRTIAFWLQSRIYAQGIAPSLFFTKPFEKAFKKLPDEVIEKFGLEVDDFIQHALKDFK